jgi:Ca2+/H+ antiporter, TMEM165/GDT1 family
MGRTVAGELLQVISTALGHAVPNIISREASRAIATCLYTFYGLRLVYAAWKGSPGDHNEGEVKEVRMRHDYHV